MTGNLPPALAAALEGLLAGVSRKDLAARVAMQSVSYRAGGSSAAITGAADVLAYLVARLPATYAATAAVLARVAEICPDFAPESLLDIGAGPGTASWAAVECWPGLAALTLRDRNPAFRGIAAQLAASGPVALAQARILAGDIAAPQEVHDLVIAAYVLAELPEHDAARITEHLWDTAGTMLVLVEPGTPAGFARIRAARAALIDRNAHVMAPCTHDKDCPIPTNGMDWCHFSQRLSRSRDHMIAKGAHVPFEDERYAYVAVTRDVMDHRGAARIIKPPHAARPGVTLPLCDDGGLRDAFIARRDPQAHRRARRLGWGDLYRAC